MKLLSSIYACSHKQQVWIKSKEKKNLSKRCNAAYVSSYCALHAISCANSWHWNHAFPSKASNLTTYAKHGTKYCIIWIASPLAYTFDKPVWVLHGPSTVQPTWTAWGLRGWLSMTYFPIRNMLLISLLSRGWGYFSRFYSSKWYQDTEVNVGLN